ERGEAGQRPVGQDQRPTGGGHQPAGRVDGQVRVPPDAGVHGTQQHAVGVELVDVRVVGVHGEDVAVLIDGDGPQVPVQVDPPQESQGGRIKHVELEPARAAPGGLAVEQAVLADGELDVVGAAGEAHGGGVVDAEADDAVGRAGAGRGHVGD